MPKAYGIDRKVPGRQTGCHDDDGERSSVPSGYQRGLHGFASCWSDVLRWDLIARGVRRDGQIMIIVIVQIPEQVNLQIVPDSIKVGVDQIGMLTAWTLLAVSAESSANKTTVPLRDEPHDVP